MAPPLETAPDGEPLQAQTTTVVRPEKVLPLMVGVDPPQTFTPPYRVGAARKTSAIAVGMRITYSCVEVSPPLAASMASWIVAYWPGTSSCPCAIGERNKIVDKMAGKTLRIVGTFISQPSFRTRHPYPPRTVNRFPARGFQRLRPTSFIWWSRRQCLPSLLANAAVFIHTYDDVANSGVGERRDIREHLTFAAIGREIRLAFEVKKLIFRGPFLN